MPTRSKTKILYNPRCSKCREALCQIQEAGIEPEIIEYLKTPPTSAEIKDILMKLHLKPQDIIRTTEEIYKKKFAKKKFTDDEWIQVMIENPSLIQRPIIIKGTKAVIGRSPEQLETILKK